MRHADAPPRPDDPRDEHRREVVGARNAGYTDAQLVDISLDLAVIAFTNAFNRIDDTTLDFPAAA